MQGPKALDKRKAGAPGRRGRRFAPTDAGKALGGARKGDRINGEHEGLHGSDVGEALLEQRRCTAGMTMRSRRNSR